MLTKKEQLIQYLENFCNPKRIQLLNANIENRTRYLTIVLEDLYQPHNASAILRSCDCFGIQDIHVIENRNKYSPNDEIAMGSEKWLNIYKYNNFPDNTLHALQNLKKQGYRIVSTSSHTQEVNLEKFDLTQGKVAFVFGTELTGVSERVMKLSDEFLTIPMFGFTESLNISVAAAILLHHLSWKLRQSDISWKLSEDEKNDLKVSWLKTSIKKADLIEKHFLEKVYPNFTKAGDLF
jgi:tRNA (guanosine-2'-O-)-methyltransferase